jgi:hypothetical protein
MIANAAFLTPVLALVAWTLVMWVWLYATRLPAMRAAGINPQDARHPGTYDHRMPERARSAAENYNHLHEQPTIFYALMFYLALSGGADARALTLAWVYVAIRVVHSLIQATINVVMLRFVVFLIGSITLVAMTVCEVLRLLG